MMSEEQNTGFAEGFKTLTQDQQIRLLQIALVPQRQEAFGEGINYGQYTDVMKSSVDLALFERAGFIKRTNETNMVRDKHYEWSDGAKTWLEGKSNILETLEKLAEQQLAATQSM